MKAQTFAAVILAASLAVAGGMAEAKRLGGGQSVGKQSSNVTQREAATPAPAAPAQSAANPAAAKPAAANTPGAPQPAAAAPKKPWGAMLGGLAAGLGLAWLAHSLGFGEAFGNMLMFALLAMAVLMVVALVMRSRRNAQAPAGGYAYGGAGAPVEPQVLREYNPDRVGNDASARPWERPGIRIGSAIGSNRPNWSIPDDFDVAGFLQAAKSNFVMLQGAWDRADLNSLRSMMTDEMLAEIRAQLADRDQHTGAQPNQTDVVMLEASLLGVEDLGEAYMASVEFSGMIREEPSAGPSPFREVWNMTKPKSGHSGWLVAGVQALQ
ncbi:MAG: Tim44 domain-containing protein [Betaproteobacteria bacterium]|jgi:predicted lipid-binding transport protein (Tim44 family)|nr:Tim44 domain-containing protein [Betaproteobacteria bacterium]